MEADAKSVPFMLLHTRAAVGPEARKAAWVQPCQPSSQVAILQTQGKKDKNMKAGVIQANGERSREQHCPRLPAASGEGSDNGSRGSTHS